MLLTAGQTTTVQVTVGRALKFDQSIGSGSVVQVLPSLGSPVTLTGATEQFGPFDEGRYFRIECTAGIIDYSVGTDWADLPSPDVLTYLQRNATAARVALGVEAERKARLLRAASRVRGLPQLMLSPPTITIATNVTGNPASTYPTARQITGGVLTNAWNGPLRVFGGLVAQSNTIGVTVGTVWNGSSYLMYGHGYEFMFDGPDDGKFEIYHASNGAKFDILVDKGDGLGFQYIAARGSLNASSGGNSHTALIDFGGGVSGYRVRVESSNGPLFGIGTRPENRIYAPPADDLIRAVFVGDSWTGPGTSSAAPHTNFVWRTSRRLGWTAPMASGIGSTGILKTNGGSAPNYRMRAPSDIFLVTDPEVLVIQAPSTNDGSLVQADVVAEIQAFLTAIRAQSAYATIPIFCVGSNQGSGTNAAGQVYPTALTAAVLAACV